MNSTTERTTKPARILTIQQLLTLHAFMLKKQEVLRNLKNTDIARQATAEMQIPVSDSTVRKIKLELGWVTEPAKKAGQIDAEHIQLLEARLAKLESVVFGKPQTGGAQSNLPL